MDEINRKKEYLEKENENKKTNSYNEESDEDIIFSGLLPSSNHKKSKDLINDSPPEINLLDPIKSNNNNSKEFFFRRLTQSRCEVSPSENNAITENIFHYFEYHKQREYYLFPSKLYDETHNIMSKQSINLNSGINKMEESYNSDIDSVILNAERMLYQPFEVMNVLENNSELAILERNKQIYLSHNHFNFNVLVVGESGSGKTSFIRNFLKKVEKISSPKHHNNDCTSFNVTCKDNSVINDKDIIPGVPTMKFHVYKVNNLSFSQSYDLRIIDSPGYGSKLNKTEWLNHILEFIHKKNLDYFHRKQDNIKESSDCRIHLILYFITGPKPKIVDYSIMKDLQKSANILPILSNANSNDFDQVLNLKSEMITHLKNYDVEIFDVQNALSKLCWNQISINFLLGGKLGFCPPFLLTISNKNTNKEIMLDDMENPEISDFLRLYYILACYIPFECVEKTKKHYKYFKNNFMITKGEKECTHFIWDILVRIISIIAIPCIIYLCKKVQN